MAPLAAAVVAEESWRSLSTYLWEFAVVVVDVFVTHEEQPRLPAVAPKRLLEAFAES